MIIKSGRNIAVILSVVPLNLPVRSSLLVWVPFLQKKNSAICVAAIMDVICCFH